MSHGNNAGNNGISMRETRTTSDEKIQSFAELSDFKIGAY